MTPPLHVWTTRKVFMSWIPSIDWRRSLWVLWSTAQVWESDQIAKLRDMSPSTCSIARRARCRHVQVLVHVHGDEWSILDGPGYVHRKRQVLISQHTDTHVFFRVYFISISSFKCAIVSPSLEQNKVEIHSRLPGDLPIFQIHLPQGKSTYRR